MTREDAKELIRAQKNAIQLYRDGRAAQLVELEQRVLGYITDEKLESASLGTLVKVLKTLVDLDLVLAGKPTQIKGLVGFLMQLDADDAAIDVTPRGEELPKL